MGWEYTAKAASVGECGKTASPWDEAVRLTDVGIRSERQPTSGNHGKGCAPLLPSRGTGKQGASAEVPNGDKHRDGTAGLLSPHLYYWWVEGTVPWWHRMTY